MPQIVMPSISANGSPSMIMRSANVPLSPSSALQTTYLRSAAVSATVFHLMPVGKPAPPAKPGFRHFGDDRGWLDLEGAFEPLPAVMRGVIGKRERIDDAAADKGEARLARQKRMLLRLSDPERMRAAGHQAGVEEGSNVRSRNRAITDAPVGCLDLDQGLEKEHPARAGADDLDRKRAHTRLG